MVQLQENLNDIKAAKIDVVAVSYDSVKVLKQFSEKRKVAFPLLSDPESKTITGYGVLNDQARGRQEGIPHPGTFVIDSRGVVVAHLLGTVRKRHSPQELIDAVKKLK